MIQGCSNQQWQSSLDFADSVIPKKTRGSFEIDFRYNFNDCGDEFDVYQVYFADSGKTCLVWEAELADGTCQIIGVECF